MVLNRNLKMHWEIVYTDHDSLYSTLQPPVLPTIEGLPSSICRNGVLNFAEHPQESIVTLLEHLTCGLLFDVQFGYRIKLVSRPSILTMPEVSVSINVERERVSRLESSPRRLSPSTKLTLRRAEQRKAVGSAQDYNSSGTDNSEDDWPPAYKAIPLSVTAQSIGGSNVASVCKRIIEDGVTVASTTGETKAGRASSCQLQSRDLPSRRLLGKGLSGIGYETLWNGERFARKDFIGVPRDIFEEEAAVLVGLKDHMNVVKTHGWTADKRSCSLVLDLMDDDLLSLLQKKFAIEQDLVGVCSGGQSSTSTVRQHFDNLSEALNTMLQIAKGLEYLHEQGVAHGDLKTKNILVTNGDQTLKLVKVADFGLVRTKRKSKSNVSRQVQKLDIVKWKAPEYLEILFRQLNLSNNDDGTSSESDSNSESEGSPTPSAVNVRLRRPDFFVADVYSFAVTCSQILTGKDPYPDLDWKDLGNKILSGLRPILPDACPSLLRNLLMSCWGDDAQRPTFSKIRKRLEYQYASLTTESWKEQTMDALVKYVRYTNEQVEALERVYHECPKPSSILRDELIKENPILSNIEPKQIKLWFQNRRCREKQRKEATRLVSVNAKLTALNKLLMEENERLAKHSSQLTMENHALRQQLPSQPFADGRHRVASQNPLKKEGAVNGGDESSEVCEEGSTAVGVYSLHKLGTHGSKKMVTQIQDPEADGIVSAAWITDVEKAQEVSCITDVEKTQEVSCEDIYQELFWAY